jgi:hypothetical protein
MASHVAVLHRAIQSQPWFQLQLPPGCEAWNCFMPLFPHLETRDKADGKDLAMSLMRRRQCLPGVRAPTLSNLGVVSMPAEVHLTFLAILAPLHVTVSQRSRDSVCPQTLQPSAPQVATAVPSHTSPSANPGAPGLVKAITPRGHWKVMSCDK